ncbi:NAD(P)H-dependent oxidoreductase, partial [Salmonella enterica subsp. enterica serovar Kentucky]|nr:NAD(P)H-dependent oxidoreductase [Salmonella enterica subsp. enterica serovar Kentucky]
QAGLTFRFTSTGATGLLADRPAFIVSTRGGIYSDTRHRELDQVRKYQATVTECIPMMIRTLMVQPAAPTDRQHHLREVMFYL